MTAAVLEFSHVSVRIPRHDGLDAWVVRDVNLAVQPAEIFGIIGESGSGKTMLGRSVMRLLPDTARVDGSIRLDGDDVLSSGPEAMRSIRGRRVAMIFQDPTMAFNPTLRVGYQVTEPLMIHQHESRERALGLAPGMLEHVRISEPKHRAVQYPFELSGGMLQRAMIASAVALHPSVLIADEPTTGLDVTIQADILALFRQMRDELQASVVLITHDLGVVAETCDRVAVMYAGEIVEVGPVDEIINFPRHPYTRALLRATPDVDDPAGDLESIPGGLPGPEDHTAACRFQERCPLRMEQCGEHPQLEQLSQSHAVRCWAESGLSA